MKNDIFELDRQLRDAEDRFKIKLDSYYNKLEKSVLSQVSRYKKEGKLVIPKSIEDGLANLFKGYFKEIDKISTKITKQELLGSLSKVDDKEIADIKTDKRKKYNIIYAKKLADRQYRQYLEQIKSLLGQAIDDNNKISVKELKNLVKQKTKSYKNLRISSTSETESNRVANDSRKEIFKEAGIKAIKFKAVIDMRTSKICLSRNNIVISLKSKYLKWFLPPLHVHCRSYIKAVEIDKDSKLTSEQKIKEILRTTNANPTRVVMRIK